MNPPMRLHRFVERVSAAPSLASDDTDASFNGSKRTCSRRAERSFFLDGLGQMAQGFAETLVQLIVVELEKLINAVAGVALSAPRMAAPA